MMHPSPSAVRCIRRDREREIAFDDGDDALAAPHYQGVGAPASKNEVVTGGMQYELSGRFARPEGIKSARKPSPRRCTMIE
jgi:hypothetical protein